MTAIDLHNPLAPQTRRAGACGFWASPHADRCRATFIPTVGRPTGRPTVATGLPEEERTMSVTLSRRRIALASALCSLLIAVALYGLSWGGSASAASTTTIVFAESGLGTEGQQTQTAITAFEKANPSIKVTIDVLSPNSTTYLQQLQQHFIAGSSPPDVFESDVTYPAKFALAGWIKPLTSLHPNMGQFFATEVAAGTYKGVAYAVPWFDNPEGLLYRTDLIKTPPTSPAQVVSDAQAAMKADKSLKEGLAFQGAKYEG